jgi:staphylococcal nuclease domain-containing protein 1
MATTAVPPATATAAEPRRPVILPSRGVARVKSVLSGDTVILLGKASGPNEKAPEVVFTLENISAPRYVSKLSVSSLFVRIRWRSLATDPLNSSDRSPKK